MKNSRGGCSCPSNAEPASCVHRLYLGSTPWLIKKSHPLVVDLSAEATSLNPWGFAISTPSTKLGLTLPGPQKLTPRISRSIHVSRPTYFSLPGQIHLNRSLSQTSMLGWMLPTPVSRNFFHPSSSYAAIWTVVGISTCSFSLSAFRRVI